MKKILLLTAAGLIFQATPVLAEPYGEKAAEKGSKMFEKRDLNSDGVISEAEFLAHAKAKFAEKDTNNDGSISKDEAKAAHAAKREKRKEMKEKWKEKRQDKYQERREKMEERSGLSD